MVAPVCQAFDNPRRRHCMFDRSGRQTVIAGHDSAAVNHVSPGAMVLLIRQCKFFEKSIERRLAAIECVELVAAVQRLGASTGWRRVIAEIHWAGQTMP